MQSWILHPPPPNSISGPGDRQCQKLKSYQAVEGQSSYQSPSDNIVI